MSFRVQRSCDTLRPERYLTTEDEKASNWRLTSDDFQLAKKLIAASPCCQNRKNRAEIRGQTDPEIDKPCENNGLRRKRFVRFRTFSYDPVRSRTFFGTRVRPVAWLENEDSLCWVASIAASPQPRGRYCWDGLGGAIRPHPREHRVVASIRSAGSRESRSRLPAGPPKR